MKNALRITVGLLAIATLAGCQKNKTGSTNVRGRQAISATAQTTSAATSGTVTVSTQAELNEVSNFLIPEQQSSGQAIGQLVSMSVSIHMCNSVGSTTSTAQVPINGTNATIEVDVADSYTQQGLGMLVAKVPFTTGYLMSVGDGYTYIAAEFGDGSGNIAFDGYIDPSGNLTQGRLMNDTFGQSTGLTQMGSFTLSGATWTQTCN